MNTAKALALATCFLCIPLSIATAGSSNTTSGRGDNEAIQVLTEELHQLRAVLNHSLSVNSKAQILFERIKLQSDKVYKLKQALEKVTDEIDEKTDEIDRDTERIRAYEASKNGKLQSEGQQPDKNELIEILETEKSALDRLKNREYLYRSDFLKEEAILRQLSENIDSLEQDLLTHK